MPQTCFLLGLWHTPRAALANPSPLWASVGHLALPSQKHRRIRPSPGRGHQGALPSKASDFRKDRAGHPGGLGLIFLKEQVGLAGAPRLPAGRRSQPCPSPAAPAAAGPTMPATINYSESEGRRELVIKDWKLAGGWGSF